MKGLLDGNENGIGMNGNSYVGLPAKQRVDSAFHINVNSALDHGTNELLPEHMERSKGIDGNPVLAAKCMQLLHICIIRTSPLSHSNIPSQRKSLLKELHVFHS